MDIKFSDEEILQYIRKWNEEMEKSMHLHKFY